MEHLDYVRKLAQLRENQHSLQKSMTEAEKDLEGTFEYKRIQALKAQGVSLMAEIETAEKNLRQSALSNPEQNTAGIYRFIEPTTYTYDHSLAVAWAFEHNMVGLCKIDTKAFEKVIASLSQPPKFVTSTKERKAQIKGDLKSFLDK